MEKKDKTFLSHLQLLQMDINSWQLYKPQQCACLYDELRGLGRQAAQSRGDTVSALLFACFEVAENNQPQEMQKLNKQRANQNKDNKAIAKQLHEYCAAVLLENLDKSAPDNALRAIHFFLFTLQSVIRERISPVLLAYCAKALQANHKSISNKQNGRQKAPDSLYTNLYRLILWMRLSSLKEEHDSMEFLENMKKLEMAHSTVFPDCKKSFCDPDIWLDDYLLKLEENFLANDEANAWLAYKLLLKGHLQLLREDIPSTRLERHTPVLHKTQSTIFCLQIFMQIDSFVRQFVLSESENDSLLTKLVLSAAVLLGNAYWLRAQSLLCFSENNHLQLDLIELESNGENEQQKAINQVIFSIHKMIILFI